MMVAVHEAWQHNRVAGANDFVCLVSGGEICESSNLDDPALTLIDGTVVYNPRHVPVVDVANHEAAADQGRCHHDVSSLRIESDCDAGRNSWRL
jgi:hypothetical protein